jgi:ParB family transcriptional regulator, chromosome partitioning protein
MTETTVRIESIRIEGRHRKDLGDLMELANSLKRTGLINPVTLTPGGLLLAGERRVAAALLLGWQVIDARVVDTFDDAAMALRLERDENTERKAMTPSELVSLGAALEALERPKAAARKHEGDRRGAAKRHGRIDEPASRSGDRDAGNPGEVRDVVAGALGIGGMTYFRAKTVVRAANDPGRSEEERAIAQQAVTDMDSGTTSVTGAYRRVKTAIVTVPPTATKITNAAGQRRAIRATCTTLSGVVAGLHQIETIHPQIADSEEVAQWIGDLSQARAALARLINQLKEHTNHAAQA